MRLCSEHGLPEPKANLSVAGHEVDLLWPDAGLIVEVDGAAVHRTSLAFHQDRRRDRELAARGYLVVRVTELDLEDPAALAGEMKRLRECRGAAAVGRFAAG